MNSIQVKLMLLFLVFALVPLCVVGRLSIQTAEKIILRNCLKKAKKEPVASP
jgi:hypothetical protein